MALSLFTLHFYKQGRVLRTVQAERNCDNKDNKYKFKDKICDKENTDNKDTNCNIPLMENVNA